MDEQKTDQAAPQDKQKVIGTKKKKNPFLGILIFSCFLAVLVFLPIPLKGYFLSRAAGYFNQATASSRESVFKKNLGESIKYLNWMILCNTYSLLERSGMSEAYYRLGLANLYLRNNAEARLNFENARKAFSAKETYTTIEDLESKILQSQVKLEGFIGKNEALVNQHVVKEGDVVNGITVLRITRDYVLFKSGSHIFSDSFDKYSPQAKKMGQGCQSLLESAQKDAMGFARTYYYAAKICAQDALQFASMDSEQVREMKGIAAKSAQKINEIDAGIGEAKNNKAVIIGMNKKDVEGALGNPLKKQKLFEMEFEESWIYPDKVLYFKSNAKFGAEAIVAKIENNDSQPATPAQ